MIVYTDSDPLAGISKHLTDRKAMELYHTWRTNFGVTILGGDPSGILHVDISRASKESVFNWFDVIGCQCVDIQPQDIPTFVGRSVATLAAADLLNADPAVQHGCCRLEPGEIISTVDELIRLALQVSDAQRDAGDAYLASITDEGARNMITYDRDNADQAALIRLRNAGFDVGPDDVSLEPPAPVEQEFPADFGGSNRVVIDPFAQFNN